MLQTQSQVQLHSTGNSFSSVSLTHPLPLELQLGPVSLHFSTPQQLLQLVQQRTNLQQSSSSSSSSISSSKKQRQQRQQSCSS
jgi:hypothetical protein